MQENVIKNKIKFKGVLDMCLNILKPAENIKNTTQIWIPLKAAATQVISKKAVKKREII